MGFADPEHRRVLGVSVDAPLSNWYELLGASTSASQPDLEQAMLQRMMQVRKYHVGAYQAHALALMSELSQAYVTLSDPQARAAYDRSLVAQPTAAGTLEDVAAEVLADLPLARTSESQAGVHAPATPPPRRIPAQGAASPPPRAQSADAARPPCPQCGKPMPAALAVCLHCGYKRLAAAGASSAKRAAGDASLASLSNTAISELLRLNLSPEQTLARLQLMANLYRAQRDAATAWTSAPPSFCSFCRHPLAMRSDAHALTAAALAGFDAYVTYFAKKREAQGKLHVSWPLSATDRERVGQAICGGNPQAVRLFCRTCTERILSSPRTPETSC